MAGDELGVLMGNVFSLVLMIISVDTYCASCTPSAYLSCLMRVCVFLILLLTRLLCKMIMLRNLNASH